MKYSLLAIFLLVGYTVYSQSQSVGLTDNTIDGSFDFSSNPITGSPTLNGNIGVNYDVLAARLFLASPTSGTDRPTFRGIDALDLPVADNTSQAGIVSTTNQTFGGAKSFSSSVAITGTSGNTFALESSGFVYDATNNRIGINNSTPAYFFDMQAPTSTVTYFVNRNSAGNESFLMDFSSDNIRLGLIDAAGNTTIKFRSNSLSFIQNHFMIGDDASMDVHPQFKVVGWQSYTTGNTDMINYQSTIQRHSDTTGKSASLGFGVDADKSSIGAYISFVRTGNPSKGGLHFGVYNSGGTSIDDILTLESGQVIFNNQTSSSIAVFDDSKNLISGIIGSGLSLNSNTLSGLGYTEQFSFGQFNPNDASTYYGGGQVQSSGTTAGVSRIYIPKSGTIKACYLVFDNSGILGSTETSTISIRVNNTTDNTISTTITNDMRPTIFSNTSMSISVTAGDYIEIKWVTPTWSTNPTSVRISGTIYIE